MIFILGNLISLFFEQPILNLLKNYAGIKKRREINSKIDLRTEISEELADLKRR